VVLVADDSETVRALVRLELEAAGHVVVEAADGRKALAAAAEQSPAVVLLDVEMPVLDGYATLRALKADPATADVPVVFLTGRTGLDDVVEALRLGAHDYLRKPPEPTELLARVGAALRVSALQDELRRRAAELDVVSRTDHLTGLHNRRHVEEHLRAAEAAARRHGHQLSVLVVDVDHFKAVNDSVGHAAGDAVLREVATRLRTCLRVDDVLGRWGGEEFLVLAAHTGPTDARRLGERLCAAVRHEPVKLAQSAVAVAVTVSVGGAALGTGGCAELLALADGNLYAAKDAGRDCVRVSVGPGGQQEATGAV